MTAAGPWHRVAVACFAVMALAQIAVPLVDDDRALTMVVIVGFTATSASLAAAAWGVARAGLALGVVAVGTLALERVGHTTGFPFGEYDYTDALQPQLGGVPVIVPLAWFAMGVPALAAARRLVGPGVATAVVGSIALTAWDLFLDPQMVGEGYWEWAVDGRYRGIPLSNYLGWLGSGVVVLAALDRILPRQAPAAGSAATGPVSGLVGLYLWWAVMNTIGFVVFFGDPLVGVVGGVVMVPIAVAAARPEIGRAVEAVRTRRSVPT